MLGHGEHAAEGGQRAAPAHARRRDGLEGPHLPARARRPLQGAPPRAAAGPRRSRWRACEADRPRLQHPDLPGGRARGRRSHRVRRRARARRRAARRHRQRGQGPDAARPRRRRPRRPVGLDARQGLRAGRGAREVRRPAEQAPRSARARPATPPTTCPACPSVGPKTAADLLRAFGSIDGIYANLDEIKKAKLQETLAHARGRRAHLAEARRRSTRRRRSTGIRSSSRYGERERRRSCGASSPSSSSRGMLDQLKPARRPTTRDVHARVPSTRRRSQRRSSRRGRARAAVLVASRRRGDGASIRCARRRRSAARRSRRAPGEGVYVPLAPPLPRRARAARVGRRRARRSRRSSPTRRSIKVGHDLKTIEVRPRRATSAPLDGPDLRHACSASYLLDPEAPTHAEGARRGASSGVELVDLRRGAPQAARVAARLRRARRRARDRSTRRPTARGRAGARGALRAAPRDGGARRAHARRRAAALARARRRWR